MKRILGDTKKEREEGESHENNERMEETIAMEERRTEPRIEITPSIDLVDNQQAIVNDSVNGIQTGNSPNGIRPQLVSQLEGVGDSVNNVEASLDRGHFGFNTAQLHQRQNVNMINGELDESELLMARELLLRSEVGGGGVDGGLEGLRRREGAPPRRSSPLDSDRRSPLDSIGPPSTVSPTSAASPASVAGRAGRRKPQAQWYTKAWFRTSFTILLALFIRVMMALRLNSLFSDSAFLPFLSMELSFLAAAAATKPAGLRIPIGGSIVESVVSALGFSREMLGNAIWWYEFGIQKPMQEFFLFFFAFVVAHLGIVHAQDYKPHMHEEL